MSFVLLYFLVKCKITPSIQEYSYLVPKILHLAVLEFYIRTEVRAQNCNYGIVEGPCVKFGKSFWEFV